MRLGRVTLSLIVVVSFLLNCSAQSSLAQIQLEAAYQPPAESESGMEPAGPMSPGVPGVPRQPNAGPYPQATPLTPPTSAQDELDRELASARANRRRARRRRPITRAPDMFGDIFGSGVIANNTAAVVGPFVNTTMPLSGGSRRLKICENNQALPQDRVYAAYNHFHNAWRFNRFAATLLESTPSDVDRITLGFEKTCGPCNSVEFRLPLSNNYQVSPADISLQGGHIGDLQIVTKRLLYDDETVAVSAGLGVSLPTGSDVDGSLPLQGVTYRVLSDAVHLSPYLGTLITRNQFFAHGFVETNIPLSGNAVIVTGAPDTSLDEQVLLHLDMGIGYWLYRNPCRQGLTGLAATVELHYTTPLNDADLIITPGGAPVSFFTSPLNRYDVLNLTAGIQANINRDSSLRFGCVAPLRDGENRFFDAELQASWIRRF